MLDPQLLRRPHRADFVIDQFGGILPQYEAFYLVSIIQTAAFSLDAFAQFDEALESEESARLIVAFLHAALSQAAALSRFFWPKYSEGLLSAARGKKLRRAFLLEDASALRWRRARNKLEHFDEDLDQLLLDDRVGIFYPQAVIGPICAEQEVPQHIFKQIEPIEGVFVLLGERYEYRPIRAEVERVFALALGFEREGCRLPAE